MELDAMYMMKSEEVKFILFIPGKPLRDKGHMQNFLTESPLYGHSKERAIHFSNFLTPTAVLKHLTFFPWEKLPNGESFQICMVIIEDAQV
jgi:hypothetical protein